MPTCQGRYAPPYAVALLLPQARTILKYALFYHGTGHLQKILNIARYSQLFTNRLAAFPVERDSVGDKVFSAFIPELFVISPRLNLFESLLAGLVEPGEGRRVLHLDNNVYTIRLTESKKANKFKTFFCETRFVQCTPKKPARFSAV